MEILPQNALAVRMDVLNLQLKMLKRSFTPNVELESNGCQLQQHRRDQVITM